MNEQTEDWVFTGNQERIWQYIPKQFIRTLDKQQETEE